MIRVFVIDDSMMVRNAIKNILADQSDIKIIGEAPNPVDAYEVFREVGFPDVFILDIEMPKMDGLTFLKKISEQNPTPVVICSTLVSLGSDNAIDALRLGAAEIVLKPTTKVKEFFYEQKQEFVQSIKAAAGAKTYLNINTAKKQPLPPNASYVGSASTKFVAIGASTGGVQVIEEIITHLRKDHAGIVITQHMPAGFTASFAKRLNALTPSLVVEASDGEVIANNKIIIARGQIHMEVIKAKQHYEVINKDFPKVNYHKPSVNVLFHSIAKSCQDNVTAFILTGMGDDGAKGLKKLKDKGCETYGQSERSCAVYGMPHAAKQIGALCSELSIEQIIEKINAITE